MNDFDLARKLADELSTYKRLATGQPTVAFPVEELRGVYGEFDRFAEEMYKWFWEDLREDYNFVFSRGNAAENSVLRDFTTVLNDQRHLTAHRYDHAARANDWRRAQTDLTGIPRDRALSGCLVGLLCEALRCLTGIARRISRLDSDALAWRELASETPGGIVLSVCNDLGMNPATRRLAYLVRQYEQNPGLARARDGRSRRQLAESVVAGRTLAPLSVPYQDLLDEFGLIGTNAALSLILIAHALEQVSVRGAGLREALARVWNEVQRSLSQEVDVGEPR